MVKRCIGIDIGCSYLHAVQLAHGEQELRVEKVFSCQIRRSTDSLPNILKSLVSQHGFDARAAIATSLPQDAVFYRNLETDAAGLEQIRQHDSSAFEHHFPIPPGQIVVRPHSHRLLAEGRYCVLAAAVSRELVQQRCNLLAEAKLHPDLADAAIFAIHSAVAINYPEITTGVAIITYVDESHLTLAVTQDNDILIVRNLRLVYQSDSSGQSLYDQAAQILSHEVAISWRKVFGCEIEQDVRLYLATGGGISAGLRAAIEKKLPCQIIFVDPYAKLQRSPDCQANDAICVALGLALRVLAPEKTAGVDFLQVDQVGAKPALNLRKELTNFLAILVAIAALLLIGLRVRLFYMERNYARLKDEIKSVFQTTLPDEKNIVDPLVQLEQKIQSFQKDYQLFASFHPTGLAPLDVLQKVSTSMPTQDGFKVDDLWVTPSSVRISGTCDSFASVYKWQGVLQKIPGFAVVDVKPPEKLETGKVSFTILISSGKSLDMPGGIRATAEGSRRAGSQISQ